MFHVVAVFMLLIGYGASQTKDDCPAGVPRDNTLIIHSGFCFSFNFTKIPHKDARATCEKHGGTLALVKTPDLQDFLYNQLAHYYNHTHDKVWIGLNDIAAEDKFVWEDGTSLNYSNWASGEGPNSGSIQHVFQHNTEDCVILDVTARGKWHDYSCDHSVVFLSTTPELHSFICQYTPVGRSSTEPTQKSAGTSPSTTEISVQPVVTLATITNPCPPFTCDLDCGMDGFKKDATTGCSICECDI
ncbi:unnamed protein product [Lymnaea stagnalis]|uniref:C-type lectin domain-containing protein n=1 Tax=Lymnaea stagnalis TaxID=6523 RepID=A0AAV2H157_LYMST